MSRKVEVSSTREVRTYSELWHTSCCLLEMAKEDNPGAFHLLMGSIVFSAFSLEACCNHVGSKLFDCWGDLEKLSPKSKLSIICEKLEIKYEKDRRPWQIISDIFGFRNDIAHGKTEVLNISKVESLKYINSEFREFRAKTKWENFCSLENAVKVRSDIEKIVVIIFEAANIKNEYPFLSGFEVSGTSLIEE